ncbi:c-type cytochrome [Penaeicola halotolerans]|uniref:c-type cytochrome n=1 Tax=Penaeicola halotolerans TaxID=2793196 RepID=UPI001CF880EB|nr:c-type cytochrome [Penaeicola halotolerans]
MQIGMFHLHVTVVLLFIVFMTFKTLLLTLNRLETLAKIRAKTKVIDMILGVLILVTGFYLLSLSGMETYLIAKIVLVFLSIPLGIVGLKREKKPLALLSVVLLLMAYGMAETKSITMRPTPITVDVVAAEGEDLELAEAKAIYAQACENCHGADGKKGLYKAAALGASTLSYDEKVTIITNGKGIMPKFGNQLSDQQIMSLVTYIETFEE